MALGEVEKLILLIFSFQRNFMEVFRAILEMELKKCGNFNSTEFSSESFSIPHIFVAISTLESIVFRMDYKKFSLAFDLVSNLRKNLGNFLLPLTDFFEMELYLKFLHSCFFLADEKILTEAQKKKFVDDFSSRNIEKIFGTTDDFVKEKLDEKLRQFRLL